MGFYSMPCYFQTMPQVGKLLRRRDEANEQELLKVEKELYEAAAAAIQAGKPDEAVNKGGELTAMQRLEHLIDPGTWCPLNSLYNPQHNSHGSTAIIKGLARISGRWCVCVASDNKKLAGAWIPGQADNLLRASDTAKC
ncbi:MAG: glutaconyl-CoA decarboxylase subunit alpha, partial [Lachnospiraceae bacterium]|nr:glutaconyl-CoA decarboxylase subunit alpha [Lachnospiraceae bacterium]